MTRFISVFIVAFAVALVITPVVRKLALKHRVVDRPSVPRKIHKRSTPLLGGLAIMVSFLVAILLGLSLGWFPGEHIISKYLVGIIIAMIVLAVGGALDDRYDLRPSRQILFPLVAVASVIISGIGVVYVTNPFGGQLFLDRYVTTVLWWDGIPYKLTLLADIFTVTWLLGMSYTTKFLDGLDGLVSGVVVIGGLIIAAVSLTRDVSQSDTAILALIVAGIYAGFLVFNFHPAKIFLGEGGSIMAGFLLGTLAIISGGKIATTLLVLGAPLFDAAFVIFRRAVIERRSPFGADRSHLHFRLLDIGFSHRQAVLFFYFLAALFGTSTLFLSGWGKMVALGLLASVVLAVLAFGFVFFDKDKGRRDVKP